MNLTRVLFDDLLGRVEKPSRYLGTEHNSVGPAHKSMAQVRVRIALAFPDLYDLGLGNLGLHILYSVLNRLDWVWAERVYSPGLDLEALLRERGLPLFALESKDALGEFDGIGVTLQSELTFTNILNMLDLAGMPVRARDRGEGHPLVFAGGPAVFNPEPLVPFIDFFVIGDGEDVIVEIAEIFDAVPDRAGRLEALSRVEGIYVPALHPTELVDGRVFPRADHPIRKRLLRSLEDAPFPEDYLVPFTRQVHDRVSLEVLRGCTHGCRFCQAGMTSRPVRERSVDEVARLVDSTLASTGYEELSLVSLSTCDHSRVRQLVDRVVRRAAPERVGVSLPSLRLDRFSVDLADMVAGIRRTGLTFAPEAASPRLRAVINKWIPDEDLLDMARRAYGLGWGHVKLYFMIGLPTERPDDVDAIADLALRTLAVGREHNRRARVNLGVSTFVPKPFTPLQWARQIDMDETRERQDQLRDALGRVRAVRFGRHHPEETFMEGLVSRSDRSAGDLIEAAWKRGARFDAWDEHRNWAAWQAAIEDTSFDAQGALRARGLDERLPWDHLDIMVSKTWLREDWERASVLAHAEDCRHSRCNRCGVIDEERELCAHMLRNSIEGRKDEAAFHPTSTSSVSRPGAPPVRTPAPPPVQRLVLRIGLMGEARYLSHLEALNAWQRALRRAGAPLAYSEGFHPHPKMAFSHARPVAEESQADWMDLTFSRRLDPEVFWKKLDEVAPPGFGVFEAHEVPLNATALMAQVAGAAYRIQLTEPAPELEVQVAALLASERLEVSRKGKRGPRMLDVRANLQRLEVIEPGVLSLETVVVDGRGLRPREVLDAIGVSMDTARVTRLETRFRSGSDGVRLSP